MNKYEVTITGQTPLLLHNDNLDWADMMDEWRKDPANKKASKAGDDRSPAWRWIGCLYHEDGLIVIPADNLMTMLREGGAKVPTGNRNQTYKAISQSGLVVNEIGWPIVGRKGTVPWGDFESLCDEQDFAAHEAKARACGFELFKKRAKIGASKHVRVRPRFDTWSASGSITVLDDRITERVLLDILTQGGLYCGLGDWRPSSPSKPGSYGRFTAEVREVK